MNEKVRIARKRLVSADTRHKVAIIAYAEAKASHDGSADAVRECLAARLAMDAATRQHAFATSSLLLLVSEPTTQKDDAEVFAALVAERDAARRELEAVPDRVHGAFVAGVNWALRACGGTTTSGEIANAANLYAGQFV